MKRLHLAFFLLGVIGFLSSPLFIGSQTGADLWKAGVAFMLGDVVLIQLWPRKSP